MLDLGLQDTHVLITGANGGIGLPTVLLFLQQGAKVSAQYNSSSQNLLDDKQLDEYRGSLALVKCDVTDEESVREMFAIAEEERGMPVNVLVVNHAIYNSTPAPLSKMSLSQFKQTIDVNLIGSFLVIREFLKRLERGDVEEKVLDEVGIVLIGSTAGEFGEASHADYASSKSALTHGLMLSLKNEIVKIAPKGRINTVAPGWVGTKMAEESMKDPGIKYQALASTPLKKIATPLDVAHQIVILASRRVSGHVTGQIVRLHGGMEGRLLNTKEEVL